MDKKIHLEAHQQETLQCQTKSEASYLTHDNRRSANYKPNIWKHDFLESLNSKYEEGKYRRQFEKLRDNVKKHLFVETEDLVAKLELIDNITKLGLENHFEKEIKEALDTIGASITSNIFCITEDLYASALHFKILRQHGYKVSQDVFNRFMDEKGSLKKSGFANVKGMLELYEASNLALEGEDILDEAKASTKRALREAYSVRNLDSNLAKHVVHALELSSHQRVPWFDVRLHINSYDNDSNNKKTTLLELAKLNFNIVQSELQKDLREASMWWKHLGITENLSFARDRLVESFTFAMGLAFQPEYKSFRIWLTKVINLILIIDDVYDVYGSLEELRHFTNAVDQWDVRETQQLPECMKFCFQVLHNTTCETAYEIEEEKGWDQVLPHLRKAVLFLGMSLSIVEHYFLREEILLLTEIDPMLKMMSCNQLKAGCPVRRRLGLNNCIVDSLVYFQWADFCKAMFVEAEWYNRGYTPSLEEYLSNGCISSSVSVLLVHAFFASTHSKGTKEVADFLHNNEDLVHNISLIVRLTNDLATSAAEQERGDAASSIVCYMREVDACEEIARKNIKTMVDNAWKKINAKCLVGNQEVVPFLSSVIDITTNIARMAHYLYQDGDGFGEQQGNRTQIKSLLVEPLHI